jgi:hypothetical protein
MEEQVLPSLSAGDEAETLVSNQLLDRTALHGSPPLKRVRDTCDNTSSQKLEWERGTGDVERQPVRAPGRGGSLQETGNFPPGVDLSWSSTTLDPPLPQRAAGGVAIVLPVGISIRSYAIETYLSGERV